MIGLLAPLALAATFELDSVGIGGALVGVPASATYEATPGVDGWLSLDKGRFGLTAELGFTATGSETASARYTTLLPRIDALAEIVLRTHATGFRLGVGPALTLRSVSFRGGDRSVRALSLLPGARVRFALQGPVAGPVGFGFWAAATSAGAQLGYDCGLGLAWRPE